MIDDAASGVLNDPVDALLSLFEFAAAPRSHGPRVCLWLEPGGYAIDAFGTPEPDRCVMRVSFDENFVPPMQGAEMVLQFECELATTTLYLALRGALARLLEGPDAEALDRWRGDQSLESYLERFNRARAVAG